MRHDGRVHRESRIAVKLQDLSISGRKRYIAWAATCRCAGRLVYLPELEFWTFSFSLVLFLPLCHHGRPAKPQRIHLNFDTRSRCTNRAIYCRNEATPQQWLTTARWQPAFALLEQWQQQARPSRSLGQENEPARASPWPSPKVYGFWEGREY